MPGGNGDRIQARAHVGGVLQPDYHLPFALLPVPIQCRWWCQRWRRSAHLGAATAASALRRATPADTHRDIAGTAGQRHVRRTAVRSRHVIIFCSAPSLLPPHLQISFRCLSLVSGHCASCVCSAHFVHSLSLLPPSSCADIIISL